jgi:hypothetical protein
MNGIFAFLSIPRRTLQRQSCPIHKDGLFRTQIHIYKADCSAVKLIIRVIH